MKKFNLLFLFLMLFVASCATKKDANRFPAATGNAKAVNKVLEKCDFGYSGNQKFYDLVMENAVPNEARKLTGGKGINTFVMKDGRLVIVTLQDCEIDHIRFDEGKVTSAYALGRRLFTTVGQGRVFMLTAVQDQSADELFQVHEIKYDHRRFASARGFKRRLVDVPGRSSRGSGIVILRDSGEYRNRMFKPWEWGGNNENLSSYENVVDIDLIPAQQNPPRYVRLAPPPRRSRPAVTYLPKPPQTCKAEEKISFFFGLFSVTNSVEVPCS